MRGKATIYDAIPAQPGITPAYAGKRLLKRPLDTINRDHPRLCGEKHILLGWLPDFMGSPPPMRGKDSFPLLIAFTLRITPAYAGKSTSDTVKSLIQRDHPRLCGEKWYWFAVFARLWGSPPPMRGKVETFDFIEVFGGITPAYAGKSRQNELTVL